MALLVRGIPCLVGGIGLDCGGLGCRVERSYDMHGCLEPSETGAQGDEAQGSVGLGRSLTRRLSDAELCAELHGCMSSATVLPAEVAAVLC